MSAESVFAKDIALHDISRKRRTGVRPRPTRRRELTPEEQTVIQLRRIESELQVIKEELSEIKEGLMAFGIEFVKNKELAKVGLRYRKKARERQRRHQERHGDE